LILVLLELAYKFRAGSVEQQLRDWSTGTRQCSPIRWDSVHPWPKTDGLGGSTSAWEGWFWLAAYGWNASV